MMVELASSNSQGQPPDEVISRIKRVLELSAIDLKDTKVKTVGIHGTSTQTIMYLIETGFIPGYTAEEQKGIWIELPKKGDVYYYPVFRFHFSRQLLDRLTPKRRNQMRRLKSHFDPEEYLPPYKYDSYDDEHATYKAFQHYLLQALGIDLSESRSYGTLRSALEPQEEDGYNPRSRKLWINRSEPGAIQAVDAIQKEKNLSNKDLAAIVRQANRQRGFMVGLSEDIVLRNYKIKLGDLGTDLAVNCFPFYPGLPLEHISALKARGPQERSFLRELSKRITKISSVV